MTRDEIQALLPFLANGTLDGAEHAEVTAAVATDPDLAAELDALRAIRSTMKAEEGFGPGEMGLARLMRDVESAPSAAVRPAHSGRPWIWQAAAAVLLAVVLGQWALRPGPGDDAGFTLAGGGDAGLTVAFRPDATEEDLRNLLLRAQAQIVAGPTALGLYTLAPMQDVGIDDVTQVLETSDIVESISIQED